MSEPVLYCLPHAGGSAVASYTAWEPELAGLVRVEPLEPPGRGRRSLEPGWPSLEAGAWECAEQIVTTTAGRPFALFGHSIGGLVAYAIDAMLEHAGWPQPFAVVVSGTPPPNRPGPPSHTHELPEDEFLDVVSRLGGLPAVVLTHRPTREFYVELLRGDYRIASRFASAAPAHRVAAPLLVLRAADDPVGTPQDPDLWRRLACGEVTVHTLRTSDHFFLVSDRAEALSVLTQFLRRALAHRDVGAHDAA